jgi:Ca2+-binding RTX toxin-like protein
MYGEDGNDLLEGGDGADYFDCGDGLDVIIDFEPSKGDTHTNNCEDMRTSVKLTNNNLSYLITYLVLKTFINYF